MRAGSVSRLVSPCERRVAGHQGDHVTLSTQITVFTLVLSISFLYAWRGVAGGRFLLLSASNTAARA